MWGKRISGVIAIGLIVIVASGVAAAPPLQWLRGVSLDVATALAWRLFGASGDSASSPTVVVALDEETYRTPPFKGTPLVAWTGEIARVLAAVLAGGAKVVGFDVVFPTTIEDSEIEFQGQTIGERMRGFDRDFLRAIKAGAGAGKVVLGEIQLNDGLIAPAAGQRAAVGQMRNIRFLNVYGDADRVVRRVPLALSLGGALAPSMALELASRWLGAPPVLTASGVVLGGSLIPSFIGNAMTLNFGGGADRAPTYSLGDLAACAEKDDADFFRRNFAGKVVLIGSKLDVEDRKATTRRFLSAPEGAAAEGCGAGAPPAPANSSGLISGVYVQAAAVNNLLRGEAVIEIGDRTRWLIALCAAGLGAAAAMSLAPLRVALAYLILCALSAVATAIAFRHGLALPLMEVALAGLLAIVATTGFRLFVADNDKRLLRRAFEFYLPRPVIEKLIASDRPPELGGEMREVTLFFSDLVRFTTLAETTPASDLVAILNRYLAEMSDIIEAHGGFIDKYIGDAVVALFGAPLDDPQHAERAVRAALTCCARLAPLNEEIRAAGGPALAHRIGINSGRAIVGNVGSRRRFNYTAIGDAVNLAARLEAANRHYGTPIIASEHTVGLTGDAFFWREIDLVRVKGRAGAVKIYEPLALAGQETVDDAARAEGYRKGLAHWRAGEFAQATAAFARLAEADLPSAIFMKRATAAAQAPHEKGWEPIATLA
jgi:class 3 adenylate cyclase/CHASE2 domain-containing sensor protein